LSHNAYSDLENRKIDFWEIPNCIFCEKIVSHHFKPGTHHLNLKPPLQVVRCPDCHLLFLSPRPGKKLRKELMMGIVPNELSSYDQKTANYSIVNKGRKPLFDKRLELLDSLTKYKTNETRILDIGASGGAFVDQAKEFGWQAFGIEPSNPCAEKNVEHQDIVQSIAENLPYPENNFDIVHANHVFEHFINPLQAANEVFRVLKPGGLLFIEVPNQLDNIMFLRDNLFNRIPQRKRNIRSIHHLYFFSIRTLKLLLESANFSNIKINDYYSWTSRGWRSFFSLLTRFFGLFFGGGDRLQAWAYKEDKQ